jgi:hypothetical protein
MKNRKIVICISLFILIFTCFLISAKPKTVDYYLIGGVIRNSGDGWKLINDKEHEPLNMTSVETTDTSIIVHYKGAKEVISLNVTPDETMASEWYTMGASVGLDFSIISVYDKNLNLVNPKKYISSSGNIWINGIFKK